MLTALLALLGKIASIFDKRTPTLKQSEEQKARKTNEDAHREIDRRAVDARGIDTR